MKAQVNNYDKTLNLLTNDRFLLTKTAVDEGLAKLLEKGLIDELQFNRVQQQDITLKIKYKTYKKCIRQLLFGLAIIAFGLVNSFSMSYFLVISGLIVSLSSFFGITSNKLTKNQKAYLKG